MSLKTAVTSLFFSGERRVTSGHGSFSLPPARVVATVMRGPFREGRSGEGLTAAVQTIVATIAERGGFNVEGVDQRYAYRPEGRAGGCTPPDF